ncbi:MAG: Ig-like domain-containing protein [Balneolaceae bacterium]|nr:Ig-like domain-containing protein [Balneolaceae bacterium]
MEKETKKNYLKIIFSGFAVMLVLWGCERSVSSLEDAEFPDNPNVFIDTFSESLNYAVFDGAVPEAFQVDEDETYDNSPLSMRFDVPDFGDPRGSYAGGAFFTSVPRNLSGYNALTFWAKGDESTTIGVLGLGIDLNQNLYQAEVNDIQVFKNWRKIIIPIPDPEKLSTEQGMFYYASGPINQEGYTYWLDEMKFENLSTLVFRAASIMDGENVTQNVLPGTSFSITGLTSTHGLPDGTDRRVSPSPHYFNFSSSNESVAQVLPNGQVTVVGVGEATITATFRGQDAAGSYTVFSSDNLGEPENSAPTPTENAASVLSLFSDAYVDVAVDTWLTPWSEPQGSITLEDIEIQGNPTKKYSNVAAAGIETTGANLVNASSMDYFHIDLWTPNMTTVRIKLVDFGPNREFAGGDDTEDEIEFNNLAQGEWNSLKIPLDDFTGLQNRDNMAQYILSGLPSGQGILYVDNVYFSAEGGQPTEPTAAPPTPTTPEIEVISIFSEAYTDVAGTNLNPDWGQQTVVTIEPIQGVNTLKYAGLNYQGIELGSNQDVSGMGFLHIDYWTANSTAFDVFLISPGPVEEAYSLPIPTSGWSSVDIPISEFNSVDLTNVFQMKFEGNGDIWIGNIYFRQ